MDKAATKQQATTASAESAPGRRTSSFGRKLKANTRLDDLEIAAMKKMSPRQLRKIEQKEERKKGGKHKRRTSKSKGEEENIEEKGDAPELLETEEEEVSEMEAERELTQLQEMLEVQEKRTAYTSRRKTRSLSNSTDRADLPLGEDSEAERLAEEDPEDKAIRFRQEEEECHGCGSKHDLDLHSPTLQDDKSSDGEEPATEFVSCASSEVISNSLDEEAELEEQGKEEAEPQFLSLPRAILLDSDSVDVVETQQPTMEVNESKIGTSECKADMPVDRPEEILRSIDQAMTEAASLFSATPSVDFLPDLHSQALELSDSMITDKSDFLDTSSSASFESSMSSAGAESASSAVPTGKRKRGRPPKEGSRKRERASAEPSALAETITTSAPEQVASPAEVKIENVAETAVAPTTTIKKGPVAKKPRDTYYCKHCDTTFPVGFFRNVQQFGAHCSNCSRGRSLQTPDDSYAQRLPTRLQRALKRKKRQEEGTLPRKRGRKARAEKKARQPRERVKQKRYVEQWDSSDEDNKRYRKRERREPAQYDESYVYEYNDRRRLARKTHWNDIQLAKRGPRPSYSSQLALQPMSVNQVDELPQKLLLRIFSFLDKAGDLAKAGMTCRLFGRIYNHDSLWKRLFCREWKESIGYAFTGKWKARYRARLQYIESRKRPDNLPSLRLDTPMATASEQASEDGSFCSLPPVKTLTPAPTHAHWLAEKIVDSQPKVDPITGKSRMEYLIKWEGFGDEWNSWLNEEDVWCKELIEEYNSGKITVPPSASKKRRSHSSSNAGARVWEAGYGDDEEEEGEDFYARARRKTARLANTGTGGGGKGNLFIRGQEGEYLLGGDEDSSASSSLSFGSTLWELDLDLDEDLWRETWDPRGESLMSEDESDSEEYEEVPVTKEEKEKQQQEFLRSLEANPNYKPVILFFEKS